MIDPATAPAFPTAVRARYPGGRIQGVDGSMWLYRALPLAPVEGTRSDSDRLIAASPLRAALHEIAALTSIPVKRRAAARRRYRDIHLISINVPRYYRPAADHPLAEHFRHHFGHVVTYRRVALLGVRIEPKVGGTVKPTPLGRFGSLEGWRSAIESVSESMATGQTPISDYDTEAEQYGAAMSRGGLRIPTNEEIALVNSWWNNGLGPDTPLLEHAEHLHFFSSHEAAVAAHRAGAEDCHHWGGNLPGEHAVTFASVSDLDLPLIDPLDPRALWVTDLFGSYAMMVSLRARLEPARVTATQIKNRRRTNINDIEERFEQRKLDKGQQTQLLHELEWLDHNYDAGRIDSPTLINTSVVVGFDGVLDDPDQVLHHGSPVALNLMTYRQRAALAETFLASRIEANPNRLELPAHTVAFSGVTGATRIGDPEGVMLGFTENDAQPVMLSPTAASRADSQPIMVVIGQTGSGKTQVMLHLADQFARLGRPTIIVDPKQDSHHDEVVKLTGGRIASLDDLIRADGVFDPIRFAMDPQTGVELATSVLLSVNLWGDRRANMEVALQHALHYGVSRGATCTGQALQIAHAEMSNLPEGMIQAVFDHAESSAIFRGLIGFDPNTEGLRVADGLTLIKLGAANLDLPEPGVPPENLNQRTVLALVRMMILGSAMALVGRDGVLCVDEAWTIVAGGAKTELDRLGRLARSQRVFPILFTQRATDITTGAELDGHISRGLILPIEDPVEAKAALELLKIDPTPDRLHRLTSKSTASDSSSDGLTVNYNSMRALKDPITGQVLRGSVGFHSDLHGRVAPVEIVLHPDFLAASSTSPDDVDRRTPPPAVAPTVPGFSPATGPTSGPTSGTPVGPTLNSGPSPGPGQGGTGEDQMLDSLF